MPPTGYPLSSNWCPLIGLRHSTLSICRRGTLLEGIKKFNFKRTCWSLSFVEEDVSDHTIPGHSIPDRRVYPSKDPSVSHISCSLLTGWARRWSDYLVSVSRNSRFDKWSNYLQHFRSDDENVAAMHCFRRSAGFRTVFPWCTKNFSARFRLPEKPKKLIASCSSSPNDILQVIRKRHSQMLVSSYKSIPYYF